MVFINKTIKMKSGLFKLDWKDVLNGFITAIITAFITQVAQTVEAGVLPTLVQLKASAVFGLVGGIGYLCKRLLSNDQGEVLKKSK
jgi:hypothetical protein